MQATEEAINELIDIGNTLQIQPRSPKGKALLMAIKSIKTLDEMGMIGIVEDAINENT